MPLPPTADPSPTDPIIEEILRRRFPQTALLEAMAAAAKALGSDEAAVPVSHRATVQAERERLQTLSPAELSHIRQTLVAQASAAEKARLALKQQAEQAKVAAKEAAMFYNRPKTAADFDFWLKADFWTFDESLSLLLGKEPSVVTLAAVKRELDAKALFENKSPLPAFLSTYQRLRTLALRSEVMTRTARLRPADVISWAERVAVVELPAQLRRQVLQVPEPEGKPDAPPALVNVNTTDQAVESAPAIAPDRPPQTTIKKSALIERYEGSWPTIHSDLGHANENGLSTAAKARAHGKWYEEAAIQWATQNGKIRGSLTDRVASLDGLPRMIHKIGS